KGTKPHISSPPCSPLQSGAGVVTGHGPARNAWSMSLAGYMTNVITGLSVRSALEAAVPSLSGLRFPKPRLISLAAAPVDDSLGPSGWGTRSCFSLSGGLAGDRVTIAGLA